MRSFPPRVDVWTLGASAAVLCGVFSACGASKEPESARFVERTTYYVPDEAPFEHRIVGSFNWETKEGAATERGFGPTHRTIQMGDQCYSRDSGESWTNTTADDIEGLCNAALFSSPFDGFSLLRQVASGFRSVGRSQVRGVDTTHYRGRLNVGAVQGSIEVWVDEDDVVRKSRHTGDKVDGFTSVREYFDFGVDVEVSAPPPFGGRRVER
jgi:hypothetical protein